MTEGKQIRITDLVAIGFLLIALFILSLTTESFINVGIYSGMIGSIVIIITQIVYLWRSWIG